MKAPIYNKLNQSPECTFIVFGKKILRGVQNRTILSTSKLICFLFFLMYLSACKEGVFVQPEPGTYPVHPFKTPYKSFKGNNLELFAWYGKKVTILTRADTLDKLTMHKWLSTLDSVYSYYTICTGKEPPYLSFDYYINNRNTIAVASDSSSDCNVGSMGVEISNERFNSSYNSIKNNNDFDNDIYYYLSNNFWFYDRKIGYSRYYKWGYANFMTLMAKEVVGFSTNNYWNIYRDSVERLVDIYVADPTLNWVNALASGRAVPYATLGYSQHLFSSFCLRLKRDYGGQNFVKKLWQEVDKKPENYSLTSIQTMDNFFLSACAAANKNLTNLFKTWKWTISASAQTEAAKYPQ